MHGILGELKERKETLRPTTPPKESGPSVLLCETTEDYWEAMTSTYLDKYVDALGTATFQSISFPLTRSAAASIVGIHATARGAAGDGEERLEALLDMVLSEPSSPLAALAAGVDTALGELGGEQPGFVRLSSRSPKDAVLFVPGFATMLAECEAQIVEADAQQQQQQQCHQEAGDSESSATNTRLRALYEASTRAMAIHSGRDALRLLILSARILDDLTTYVGDAGMPDMAVFVRAFRVFPVELELRAFVFNNNYTALTQYNPCVYVPRLARAKEALEAHVGAFMEAFVEARTLGLDSYVLDLILTPAEYGSPESVQTLYDDISQLEIIVCEANPMAEFAGSGLFRFEDEGDRDILLGKSGFEFRVVEGEGEVEVVENLQDEWAQYLGNNDHSSS